MRKKLAAGGYSLVEVLIAMALMGAVVMSIITLFFLARRNVYSGKQMTEAVAVGTHVTETIAAMNKSALKAAFGLADGAGSANTVEGVSFPNSFVRTTTNITSTTDPKGFLARWRDEIATQNKFNNGVVTIVFTPTVDPSNNPAQMLTGTVVRTRVFVTWNEGTRHRTITLDALKVER